MSNKLRMKNKMTVVGFNKKENRALCQRNKRDMDVKSLVYDNFKDMRAIMAMVLHDKFGFGKKRLERFAAEINALTVEANRNEQMTASKLAGVLLTRSDINMTIETDSVPFGEIMMFYYNRRYRKSSLNRREVYQLVNANMFNMLTIAGVTLRYNFKFSAKRVKQFFEETRALFNICSDYERYKLDGMELATTLLAETKYKDAEILAD